MSTGFPLSVKNEEEQESETAPIKNIKYIKICVYHTLYIRVHTFYIEERKIKY